MVSDNGIRFFDFSIFPVFIEKYMNLTYQYFYYFSFNNYNFCFTHIHTSSITNITHLFTFYHISHTKFTVKRQAQKYRSYNKEKNMEEQSTKRYFRGAWPKGGRQLNFCVLSVLRSLHNNGNIANKFRFSLVVNRGAYSYLPEISLLGNALNFVFMIRGLCLRWGLQAKENINYLHNTKEGLISVALEEYCVN